MADFNGIFGQQGWICPKCGRVFSPFTSMCPYCKGNDKSNLITATDTDSTKWDENESQVFPSTSWPSGPNTRVYEAMYNSSLI